MLQKLDTTNPKTLTRKTSLNTSESQLASNHSLCKICLHICAIWHG